MIDTKLCAEESGEDAEHQILWRRNLQALPDFQELVTLAVETCFREPQNFWAMVEDLDVSATDAAPYIPYCLRAGLELIYNLEFYEDTNRREVTYHDLLTRPRELLAPPVAWVHQYIEAFGAMLLEESFLCLGEDAEDKAAQFATAETVEEQQEIIKWLLKRVEDIQDLGQKSKSARLVMELTETVARELAAYNALPLEVHDVSTESTDPTPDDSSVATSNQAGSEENELFHPVLLSPRVIGKYPDIDFDTTCLGVSILISSFFERAGTPYVHAGVMRTAVEIGRLGMVSGVGVIRGYAAEAGVTITPAAKEYIDKVVETHRQSLLRQNAYHAAVLIRLKDGDWMQLDPNYDINTVLSNLASWQINELLKCLQASSTSGVEVSYKNEMSHLINIFPGTMSAIALSSPSDEELISILEAEVQAKEPHKELKKYIIEAINNACPDRSMLDAYTGFFIKINKLELTSEEYVESVTGEILNKYVFSSLGEEEIAQVINSSVRDSEIRKLLIDKIRMAPLYVLLKLLVDIGNLYARHAKNGLKMPHGSLEIGLPAYRIGASVLSDFDLFSGQDIPFSFWASHWASYVPYGNNPPDPNDEMQLKTYADIAGAVDSPHLSYINSRVIIGSFLEQGRKVQ